MDEDYLPGETPDDDALDDETADEAVGDAAPGGVELDDEVQADDDTTDDEADDQADADDDETADEADADDDEADADDDEADEADAEADDDTDFATVATGATVEDARRTAVAQLHKVVPSFSETDVEFIVLDEGSRGGFFGRGKSQARVEARLRPAAVSAPAVAAGDDDGAEAVARLHDFLERTLELMGIAATVEAGETAEGVRADISGDDLGLLIGRHGSTIDALQYVAAIVVNGDRRQRRQVVVDAEGYRVRRESILRAVAERTAQRAARDNAPVTLKPMSAAERKVIHLYLKDHPRVETASEGNEPFRAVVVSPRRRG